MRYSLEIGEGVKVERNSAGKDGSRHSVISQLPSDAQQRSKIEDERSQSLTIKNIRPCLFIFDILLLLI